MYLAKAHDRIIKSNNVEAGPACEIRSWEWAEGVLRLANQPISGVKVFTLLSGKLVN